MVGLAQASDPKKEHACKGLTSLRSQAPEGTRPLSSLMALASTHAIDSGEADSCVLDTPLSGYDPLRAPLMQPALPPAQGHLVLDSGPLLGALSLLCTPRSSPY